MKKRRRKKIIIGFLAIAMVFMGVGYAILSENLDIVVTTESNGNWDVVIESITTKSIHGNAVSKSAAHDGLTASFSVELYTVNDYVEYEIRVKNNGNIPAQLTSATPTAADTDGVIGFTNDATLNTVISPGSSQVITVKISVDSSSEFDITDAEYTLTLVYTQYTTDQPAVTPGGGSVVPANNQFRLLSAQGTPVITSQNMVNLSPGDLIGFGTSDTSTNEQFYVVAIFEGEGIAFFPRYLLNVGPHQKTSFNGGRDTRGLQDPNIGYARYRTTAAMNQELSTNNYLYGSVPFSTSNYWWDTTNNTFLDGYSKGESIDTEYLNQYVESYISTLDDMGFSDAISSLVGVNALTFGGIPGLSDISYLCGNEVDENTVDFSGCPSFIFDNTYWLAAPYGDNNVYGVVTNSTLGGDTTTAKIENAAYTMNYIVGIRPFIMTSFMEE